MTGPFVRVPEVHRRAFGFVATALAISLVARPSWASVLLTPAATTLRSATLALAVVALGVALARARGVAMTHRHVGRDLVA